MDKKDTITFNVLDDLDLKEDAAINSDWNIDINNVLVNRISSVNIDWKKVGNKNLFLKMAEIYSNNFSDYQILSLEKKRKAFNNILKVGLDRSNDVDWDRFLSMPVVAKYQEDKKESIREATFEEMQAILRDPKASKEDLARSKIFLTQNKDLIGKVVETNQNEGLIIKNVSLSLVEEYITREKELSK